MSTGRGMMIPVARVGDSTRIVEQALSFEPPERMPVFETIWPEWAAKWRAERGLDQSADVLDYFPLDLAVCAALEAPCVTHRRVLEDDGDAVVADDGWGRRTLTRRSGFFCHVIDRDLKEKSDLDRLTFDPVNLDVRFETFDREVAGARAAGKPVFVKIGGLYNRCAMLRGEAEFLMDLVSDPEFARALIERLAEHELQLGLEVLRRADAYAQGVWIFDDMCNQRSPMFSPAIFESMFLPVYQSIIGRLKAAGARRVFLHSDGNLGPLLDLVVEAGFNGINPVERRSGLIVEELLPRYFGRLSFIGGVCNSVILPRGTEREIRRHVETLIEAGRLGGLVVGTHSIAPDIPVANYELYRSIVKAYRRH